MLYAIAYSKFDMAKELCNQPPGCSVAKRDGLASTVETLQYIGIGSWVVGGGLRGLGIAPLAVEGATAADGGVRSMESIILDSGGLLVADTRLADWARAT